MSELIIFAIILGIAIILAAFIMKPIKEKFSDRDIGKKCPECKTGNLKRSLDHPDRVYCDAKGNDYLCDYRSK